MMKKDLFVSAVILLLCTSCGGGQKPSPRAEVWDNHKSSDSTKKAELKRAKILVPFKRTSSGGLAEVQIFLNGVPFNIWWDTGASITCISRLEFLKLVKEGKIDEKEDYVRSTIVSFADGSTAKVPIYNVQEVLIKGQDEEHYLRLTDIEVSVSEDLSAPLLLGQNVMQELPKHSFNDSLEVIEFEQ